MWSLKYTEFNYKFNKKYFLGNLIRLRWELLFNIYKNVCNLIFYILSYLSLKMT